jgi:excisionase family DNA binding protein
MENTDLLRPADVAALMGVSKARVYQLIGAGILPHTVIAGALRIPRPAWEQWLAAKSAEALGNISVQMGVTHE